jgi:hypothetical protein
MIWRRASTASASAYSAFFGGGALLTAARAYRRQGDQARRAQASMVTLHRRATEHAGGPETLIVHDYSDLPIFDVKIRFSKREHMVEVEVESDEGTKFYNTYPVVPPHGHGVLELPAGVDLAVARLRFSDSAGRRWRRDICGGLSEVRLHRLLRRW